MFSLLFCCSLLTGQEKPFDAVWKHRRETRPLNVMEILPTNEASYSLQFTQQTIDTGTINSMIGQADVYDSLAKRYWSKLTDTIPQPIITVLGEQKICYSETIEVKINGDEFKIYAFITDKERRFNEHDCYRFFVIKNFGTIFAFHQLQYASYEEVEYYSLVDIRDKNGASLINKNVLQKLISEIRGD